MQTQALWKDGLEDVIAARSAICQVDGAEGRLYYRGYEIGELAAGASFEDVTYLLWFGELPEPAEAAAFRGALAAARDLPEPVLALLRGLPRDCHPLDALRTAVSLAAAFDPDTRAGDEPANVRKAQRLVSLVPATVAAWQRIRTGREPVTARRDLSHAAHFLYLLEGREPTPEVARVLDLVLNLHADHELNASTFAARVAVATLADLHAAVTAAVATLKGPRHGGANEDVLAMLLEIADPARAEAFVEARLGARGALSRRERSDPRARIPGFGHRVYKVDDARARVLRGMAKSMAEATGRGPALRGGGAPLRQHAGADQPARQRGLLLGGGLRRARDPARFLHVDLRGGPRRRLVRPRARAVRRQSPDPPPRRLHRPRTAPTHRAPIAPRRRRAGPNRTPRAAGANEADGPLSATCGVGEVGFGEALFPQAGRRRRGRTRARRPRAHSRTR